MVQNVLNRATTAKLRLGQTEQSGVCAVFMYQKRDVSSEVPIVKLIRKKLLE